LRPTKKELLEWCSGVFDHKNTPGGDSLTVTLRHMKFGTVQDHRHMYKFYLNHYFGYDKLLRYKRYDLVGGDGDNLLLLIL
jgi:hypothetical protein